MTSRRARRTRCRCRSATAPHHSSADDHGVPSIARIQQALDKLAGHVTLSGAIAGDVAGQPAYTVRVSPKHDGGLLGAVELAFDANHAVPLRVAVLSQGDSSPVRPAHGDRHQLRNRAVRRSGRPSRAGHQDRPRAPAAGAGARRRRRPMRRTWSGAAAVAGAVPFTPGGAAVARRRCRDRAYG